MENGKLGVFENDKNLKNSRWCSGCSRLHSVLYLCDTYSPELIDAIRVGSDWYKANGSNPELLKTAINTGKDPVLVNTLKAFAGML